MKNILIWPSIFVILGYVPNHRCFLPQCEESIENATFFPISGIENLTIDQWMELICDDEASYSCKRISITQNNNGSCSEYINSASPGEECTTITEKCPKNELIFDRSIVKTSVTEDLGMTCDDLYLRSIFNSLYLGGMLLGSFSIGMVSDKFGRVKALILSIFLVGGSGLIG